MNHLKRTLGQIIENMGTVGSRCYVAGPKLQDALRACTSEPRQCSKYIICYWNDSRTTPEDIFHHSLEALQAISRLPIDCYLSLKVPVLQYDAARVRDLLEVGAQYSIRIHFDVLSAETVDPTIRLLEKLRPEFSNLGATVASRWARSSADLQRLKELCVPIRVVKGQNPDLQGGEVDPYDNYLKLIKNLKGYRYRIGLASHDSELTGKAARMLRSSKALWELEQLYGMKQVQHSNLELIQPRWYIPFGYGYVPYDVYDAPKKFSLGFRLIRDFSFGLLHAKP